MFFLDTQITGKSQAVRITNFDCKAFARNPTQHYTEKGLRLTFALIQPSWTAWTVPGTE